MACQSLRGLNRLKCWATCCQSDGAWLGGYGPPSLRPAPQPVKQVPMFYVSRRLITACTTVHHSSLSLAKSIQSTSFHPISLRPVSKLYLGLSRLLFPPGSPIKILYAFLFSPVYATCPAGLILLELITQVIFDQSYRIWTLAIQVLM